MKQTITAAVILLFSFVKTFAQEHFTNKLKSGEYPNKMAQYDFYKPSASLINHSRIKDNNALFRVEMVMLNKENKRYELDDITQIDFNGTIYNIKNARVHFNFYDDGSDRMRFDQNHYNFALYDSLGQIIGGWSIDDILIDSKDPDLGKNYEKLKSFIKVLKRGDVMVIEDIVAVSKNNTTKNFSGKFVSFY